MEKYQYQNHISEKGDHWEQDDGRRKRQFRWKAKTLNTVESTTGFPNRASRIFVIDESIVIFWLKYGGRSSIGENIVELRLLAEV